MADLDLASVAERIDRALSVEEANEAPACAPDGKAFLDVLANAERNAGADPVDQAGTTTWTGGVGLQSAPGSSLRRAGLRIKSGFYGAGSESDGRRIFEWSGRPNIKALLDMAVTVCRRLGTLEVPAHWTPGTTFSRFSNGRWSTLMRDRRMFYIACQSERYDTLARELILLSRDARSGDALASELASVTRREERQGHYARAVDAIALTSIVPLSHPDMLLAVTPLLKSSDGSVRLAMAARLVVGERLPRELVHVVSEQAVVEPERAVIESLLTVLRDIGGDDAFEALSEVATRARNDWARYAAPRLLAWIPDFPKRDERLRAYARSKDSARMRVGLAARAEAKLGTFPCHVFGNRRERELVDALRAYVRGRRNAAQKLDPAFRSGELTLRITGTPGAPGSIAEVLRRGVALVHDDERPREFCARLAHLESVTTTGVNLTDAQIAGEAALYRFAPGFLTRLHGEARARITSGLGGLGKIESAFAKTIEYFVAVEAGDRPPATHFVTELTSDVQLDQLLSLLSACPRVAAAVVAAMVIGPRTGAPERIQAFRSIWPNLKLFWGYPADKPGDVKKHVAAFEALITAPETFDPDWEVDLRPSERAVLWMAKASLDPR